MVALNPDYAPAPSPNRSQNRVGDFFGDSTDCARSSCRLAQQPRRENECCDYETASETIFVNFVDPTGRASDGTYQPGDPIGKSPGTDLGVLGTIDQGLYNSARNINPTDVQFWHNVVDGVKALPGAMRTAADLIGAGFDPNYSPYKVSAETRATVNLVSDSLGTQAGNLVYGTPVQRAEAGTSLFTGGVETFVIGKAGYDRYTGPNPSRQLDNINFDWSKAEFNALVNDVGLDTTTIYHGGDLLNGRADGVRPLSTTPELSKARQHADGGSIYQFDVPNDVFRSWDLPRAQDTFEGIPGSEYRIPADLGEELNKYLRD